jgi:hypothetical protein
MKNEHTVGEKGIEDQLLARKKTGLGQQGSKTFLAMFPQNSRKAPAFNVSRTALQSRKRPMAAVGHSYRKCKKTMAEGVISRSFIARVKQKAKYRRPSASPVRRNAAVALNSTSLLSHHNATSTEILCQQIRKKFYFF